MLLVPRPDYPDQPYHHHHYSSFYRIHHVKSVHNMTSHALEMASESGEQPTTTADFNFDFERIHRWIRSVEPAPAGESVSQSIAIAIARARGDYKNRNRSTDADTNGPFKGIGKNGRREEESEVGRGGDGEAAKGKVSGSGSGSGSGWGHSRVDRQERTTSEVVSKVNNRAHDRFALLSLSNPYPSSTSHYSSTRIMMITITIATPNSTPQSPCPNSARST